MFKRQLVGVITRTSEHTVILQFIVCSSLYCHAICTCFVECEYFLKSMSLVGMIGKLIHTKLWFEFTLILVCTHLLFSTLTIVDEYVYLTFRNISHKTLNIIKFDTKITCEPIPATNQYCICMQCW